MPVSSHSLAALVTVDESVCPTYRAEHIQSLVREKVLLLRQESYELLGAYSR